MIGLEFPLKVLDEAGVRRGESGRCFEIHRLIPHLPDPVDAGDKLTTNGGQNCVRGE